MKTGELATLGTVLALSLALAGPVRGAEVVLEITDGPGSGFNSTKTVAPLKGNPFTTLGEQRRHAFEAAARTWGSRLLSKSPIRVEVGFENLDCSPLSGTLAGAGPLTVWRDYPEAPRAGTWYVSALADAHSGLDLDPTTADVGVVINGKVGQQGCLTTLKWDYSIGSKPLPSNRVSFYDVILHELAHGLGMTPLVDVSTGSRIGNKPSAYTRHLLDETSGKNWPKMTDAERMMSAANAGQLVWDGAQVSASGHALLAGRHAGDGLVQMYSPNRIEPGSSVSHFDLSVTAKFDELMQPNNSDMAESIVASQLLQDLTWSVDYPQVRSLDDVNGNGTPEVVLLHSEFTSGRTLLSVVDSVTGEVLFTAAVNGRFGAVGLGVLSHFGGTSADEIAFLTARYPGGASKIRVVDGGSGALLTKIPVDPRFLVLRDLEIVPDFKGSSADEVAILAMRKDTRAARIFVRDAKSAALLTQLSTAAGEQPVDLAVVESFGGSGAPELALLVRDEAAGKRFVRVFDASTKAVLAEHSLPAGFEPQFLTALPSLGGGGAQELAVLGQTVDPTEGDGTLLLILDAASGSTLTTKKLDATLLPKGIAVVPDFTDTPAAEVVVWGRRTKSLAGRVYVIDAGSGRLAKAITLNGTQEGRNVAPLPNFGGGPADELAIMVFGRAGGKLQVFIHDAGKGKRLATIKAPGGLDLPPGLDDL